MIFETIMAHPGMLYIHRSLSTLFRFINTYAIQNSTTVAILLQAMVNVFLVCLFPWRNESISNFRRGFYFIFNFALSTITLALLAAQTGNPSAFHAHWFGINYSFILILQTVLNDQESPFA